MSVQGVDAIVERDGRRYRVGPNGALMPLVEPLLKRELHEGEMTAGMAAALARARGEA